jgi:hypothetical protein
VLNSFTAAVRPDGYQETLTEITLNTVARRAGLATDGLARLRRAAEGAALFVSIDPAIGWPEHLKRA